MCNILNALFAAVAFCIGAVLLMTAAFFMTMFFKNLLKILIEEFKPKKKRKIKDIDNRK